MECPKCNGRGKVENPRYWGGNYSYIESWERGYSPSIKCKQCNGAGHTDLKSKSSSTMMQMIKCCGEYSQTYSCKR